MSSLGRLVLTGEKEVGEGNDDDEAMMENDDDAPQFTDLPSVITTSF